MFLWPRSSLVTLLNAKVYGCVHHKHVRNSIYDRCLLIVCNCMNKVQCKFSISGAGRRSILTLSSLSDMSSKNSFLVLPWFLFSLEARALYQSVNLREEQKKSQCAPGFIMSSGALAMFFISVVRNTWYSAWSFFRFLRTLYRVPAGTNWISPYRFFSKPSSVFSEKLLKSTS